MQHARKLLKAMETFKELSLACACCGKQAPKKLVSPWRPCACQAVRYCSESCQRLGWDRGHQLSCSAAVAVQQLSPPQRAVRMLAEFGPAQPDVALACIGDVAALLPSRAAELIKEKVAAALVAAIRGHRAVRPRVQRDGLLALAALTEAEAFKKVEPGKGQWAFAAPEAEPWEVALAVTKLSPPGAGVEAVLKAGGLPLAVEALHGARLGRTVLVARSRPSERALPVLRETVEVPAAADGDETAEQLHACAAACRLLSDLAAAGDGSRAEVARAGAVAAIVRAMTSAASLPAAAGGEWPPPRRTKHMAISRWEALPAAVAAVQAWGCRALDNMCGGGGTHVAAVVGGGGVAAIAEALRAHPGDAAVQRAGMATVVRLLSSGDTGDARAEWQLLCVEIARTRGDAAARSLAERVRLRGGARMEQRAAYLGRQVQVYPYARER